MVLFNGQTTSAETIDRILDHFELNFLTHLLYLLKNFLRLKFFYLLPVDSQELVSIGRTFEMYKSELNEVSSRKSTNSAMPLKVIPTHAITCAGYFFVGRITVQDCILS